MITKAILPAAGLGTRLLPFSKAMPKALLPLGARPLIHEIVNQLISSGINEIVFVINPKDPSIRKYFSHSPELEESLEKSGQGHLLEELRIIRDAARLHFVEQDVLRGTGDAIFLAEDFIRGEEAVVLAFPDVIFDSEIPVAKQLIDAYREDQGSILAVGSFYTPELLPRYAGLRISPYKPQLHRIDAYIEKPNLADINTELSTSGWYIITSDILEHLAELSPSPRGEIEFPDAIQKMIGEGRPVYGYEVEGERFDCGEREGYLKAMMHFTLKDPEFKHYIKRYINE